MDHLIIFWLLFGVYLIKNVWDLYLKFRQYRLYKTTKTRPDNVFAIISEEEFTKARAYQLDIMLFVIIVSVFKISITSIVLVGNILPMVWNIVGGLSKFIWADSGEIFHSIVFLYGLTIVAILSICFVFYLFRAIERKHGFNDETIPFLPKGRKMLLILPIMIIIGLLLGAMLWVIKDVKDDQMLYLCVLVWAVFIATSLLNDAIYSPRSNKCPPLPESSLKTKIDEFSSEQNFPLKKLYVRHGSKRSMQAYTLGFWKNARILLSDTLHPSLKKDSAEENSVGETAQETSGIDEDNDTKLSDDEVLAVLGHELGHWKLSHNLWRWIIDAASKLLMLIAFAFLYRHEDLYNAFGFASRPLLIGFFIIILFVMAPIFYLVGILKNLLYRKHEFSADKFSAEGLGYAKQLRTGLMKINNNNLFLPIDDWLYSAFNHSHPPLSERIAAIRRYE